MRRWQGASFSIFYRILSARVSSTISPFTGPSRAPNLITILNSVSSSQRHSVHFIRPYSALPSLSTYDHEVEARSHDLSFYRSEDPNRNRNEETGEILVKSYFISTSIDLKRMQADNLHHVVPPTSRSTNYIALRFCDFPSGISVFGAKSYLYCHYLVVFQYGSAVFFNVKDDEAEKYLNIVKKYASGGLSEMRKDDYIIKEEPNLEEDMEGGPDYLTLKALDTDSIRIIGSVLGQSIALDYFVSQIDGMVEEFAGINRGMEKSGTFIMDRKKLLQLVGKANSNLADVILKVGLFERSEIAWRDAKYAQIHDYLRDEFEVNQRFGSLDFKLKFVEQNIHFLQEVIQNRRSDLLEWCIIFLLSVQNIISIYEIVQSS